MAERLAPGDYDQLHHFVAAGVWNAAPLETELLIQADRLVGGSDWRMASSACRSCRAAAQYQLVMSLPGLTLDENCRRRPSKQYSLS